MVWGVFGYYGVGKLHPVAEGLRIGGKEYVDILRAAALQSAESVFGECPFIFQQDNAPGHTATVAKAWFKKNRTSVLDWPGQSPDLNPIENLWSMVQRIVHKQLFSNKHQLLGAVVQAWNSLPRNSIRSLIDSMPRRVKAVIKAKGGPTRY